MEKDSGEILSLDWGKGESNDVSKRMKNLKKKTPRGLREEGRV